jgi:hypothetical protein
MEKWPQMNTDETQIGVGSTADEYPLKSLTERVIGAAMEVHNQLGSAGG